MCKSAKQMAREPAIDAELQIACKRVADLFTVLATAFVLTMSDSRSDTTVDRRAHATALCTKLVEEEGKRKKTFAETDVKEWKKKVPERAAMLLTFEKREMKKATGGGKTTTKKSSARNAFRDSFGDVPKKLEGAVTALQKVLGNVDLATADEETEDESEDDEEEVGATARSMLRFEEMLQTLANAASETADEKAAEERRSRSKQRGVGGRHEPKQAAPTYSLPGPHRRGECGEVEEGGRGEGAGEAAEAAAEKQHEEGKEPERREQEDEESATAAAAAGSQQLR
jgi:hypothetical protein